MTKKQSAIGSQGMVTSNHPLASLAGTETLMAGGNAVDAAIATMFALTVVEPMMVTIFGAGFVNIRMADGTSTVIDNYATVPQAATPDLFEPIAGSLDHDVTGEANVTGHRSVAVGGTLLGWATAVERYGRLSLSQVMAPAIRYANNGFRVSPYLQSIITAEQGRISKFAETEDVFLPGGTIPKVGDTIRRTAYGATLAKIASAGPDYLYHGPLGRAIAGDMAANGGIITMDDIEQYKIVERPPARGHVLGHEILAPPPPSSGGAHIVQMLKILESFELGKSGFGTPDTVHLMAEAMKIAFADRYRYMADPSTTDIPLDWLMSDDYAEQRRRQIDPGKAQQYAAGLPPDRESESTTHCCAMDSDGSVVATTNTLHYGFGSKVTVPGTGMLLNNCMQLMDPVPGRTNSIAPGKRILSSMSPTIVLRDGQAVMALGVPGGLQIFGAVMQGIANVLIHGMTIQESFEAPRMWTRGLELELEQGFDDLPNLKAELERRGHAVVTPYKVAGGMNGLWRDPASGLIEGAACWRADGVPVGYSGGEGLTEGGV